MESTASATTTYVYGIAPAESFRTGSPPLRAPGIGGHGAPVRIVTFEDLVALVSDIPDMRFDLSHQHLLQHQRVLDEVLHRSDVLPFSFGTVAGSDEEVRELLLRSGFEALHEQLECVRGCVELEVKTFWDETVLFAEIAQENEEIRALRDFITESPDAADSVEQIQLGQLTETEIQLKSEWEADGLLEALEPLSVEVLVNANLTDTMLLNASFLVERAREPEFDEAMNALAAAQAGRFVFTYVGPLPPYSFIDLAFDGEEA